MLEVVWLAAVFQLRANKHTKDNPANKEVLAWITDIWIMLGCPAYPITAPWYRKAMAK